MAEAAQPGRGLQTLRHPADQMAFSFGLRAYPLSLSGFDFPFCSSLELVKETSAKDSCMTQIASGAPKLPCLCRAWRICRQIFWRGFPAEPAILLAGIPHAGPSYLYKCMQKTSRSLEMECLHCLPSVSSSQPSRPTCSMVLTVKVIRVNRCHRNITFNSKACHPFTFLSTASCNSGLGLQ